VFGKRQGGNFRAESLPAHRNDRLSGPVSLFEPMPSTRTLTSHVFQAFVAMSVTLTAAAGASAAMRAPDRPSLFAYRGMGTWVDIFDDALWADPSAAVQAMQAEGVRTIYIETSNYSHRAIVFPLKVGQFIDAAHQAGMRVVAWYLPSFEHLKADLRKSMAAIDYRSSTGGAFDSFALDIESRVVADPAARTRRLLDLSQRIRDAVGPSYPLGAILPNPVRLATESGFWPDFPYTELMQIYSVFLPMCYFGAVAKGSEAVHDYTANCIELIRTGVGDATVPIHEIGGVANNLDGVEISAFVHTIRENGLLGGSLYDFVTTTDPTAWDSLRTLPVNPKQFPALPMPIGSADALGNVPRVDRTHPKEVFYLAPGAAGSMNLTFQAFDVGEGELTLWVNWQLVRTIRTGPASKWTRTRTTAIPDELLLDDAPNYVAFTASGDFPAWSIWGVREVNLTAP